MPPTVPAYFLGVFLLLFASSVGVCVFIISDKLQSKSFLFVAFHLASLLFVLAFLFNGWKQPSLQFVEVGHYYPLDAAPDARGATVSVGSADRSPDFVVERKCQPGRCYSGLVQFRFESNAGAPNRLTWQTDGGFIGRLYVVQPRHGFFGRALDGVLARLPLGAEPGRSHADGAAGISLHGEINRVVAVWEPPAGDSAPPPLRLSITVELNPPETPPRITIGHPSPQVIELTTRRNAGSGGDTTPDAPHMLFLTSSNDVVALKPTARPDDSSRDRFTPTISVGAADPQSRVTAFVEFPEGGAGEFVVNTGLSRTGNSLGRLVYVGGRRGVVATVTGRGSVWKYVWACALLWLIPLAYFIPLVRVGYLWALVSVVQMILGVRFVLALRAYLWPPYSEQAMESAILALVLVPLLLFMGCFLVGLRYIGAARERRHKLLELIKSYPPFVYYVVAVAALAVLSATLGTPASGLAASEATAFGGRAANHKPLLLVALLPPLVWLAGFLIDRGLRRGHDRDVRYTGAAGEEDDPLLYSLTQPTEALRMPGEWTRRHTLSLFTAAVIGAVTFGVWMAGRAAAGEARGDGIALGVGVLLTLGAVAVKRFANLTKSVNEVVSAASTAICRLVLCVSVLLILKSLWNLSLARMGFGRAGAAALFPYLPLRTNSVFELLILVLTFKLLTTFFENWRDANSPFGWREMLNLAVVFFSPAFLFLLSLMASHDTGAMLVHGPALVGGTLLLSGLWPLWKAATGRREALWAIALSLGVILLYLLVSFTSATKVVTPLRPHDTIAHRIVLLEGTEAAARSAEVGGPQLLEAIEQNWRMMNYAAEGGWGGRGYGNAPIPRDTTFSNITLDDLVFAVYVLAEHGALGGLGLLLLYLLFFCVVLKATWDRLGGDPLRAALAVTLGLMIVFPAFYMMAANLNQGIFTGQNIPLLGLRSDSDVLRSGLVLMLLAAALRLGSLGWQSEQARRSPGWVRLVLHGLSMARLGRARKAERLESLTYSPSASDAAVAGNIALVLALVLAVALLPVAGLVKASGNDDYKKPLDLTGLKERAAQYVSGGHVWFEPISDGETPGANCRGGSFKNTANGPSGPPPTRAYQLCVDDDVEGAGRDDTISALVKQWNARRAGRGNTVDLSYDARQFFQLDVDRISRAGVARAIRVNPSVYRWTSPFQPLSGWIGTLTSADSAATGGGVLVGPGMTLPLRAAPAEELPVFVGTEQVRADLGSNTIHQPARAFSVYDPELKTSIFRVETVSGALGALLRPQDGDFDIFINGCPLAVGSTSDCELPSGGEAATGTAPPVRIDYGDVIAYAPRDPTGRRFPRHVFVYSAAQVGAFSGLAWVNGSLKRHYPQGESWPMAQQISKALAASADGGAVSRDVVLTVDAALNRELYELLRRWRAELDRRVPVKRGQRRMAITLMNTDTGELLALASDDGTPHDPNTADQRADDQPNLNLTRHRIGSLIKPFTAAATLKAFPRLHEMTLLDSRAQKRNVFGLPLGDEDGIVGRGGASVITWDSFMARSDNLYAVTLSLLGMCEQTNTQGVPRFEGGAVAPGPFTLELTDGGSNFGMPRWSSPSMFDAAQNRVALLEQTPLARQLQELFDTRTGVPQASSYDAGMWSRLGDRWELGGALNIVSPEVTNFALADIDNFSDLRSVLLGGEFAGPEEYGNIGSAWSNVHLAQSLARLVTGRRIVARIVGGEGAAFEELAPADSGARWRRALLRSLERVATDPSGTAYASFHDTIRAIAGGRGAAAAGRGTRFTVISKTGTLDPDNFGRGVRGPRHSDSIFAFTAGFWDDSRGAFSRSVTGAVYIEQASEQVKELAASALAAEVVKTVDRHPQFGWGGK